jgi:Tfp pilus assembly protein PilF
VKIITRNGLIRPGYLNQLRRQHPNLEIPVQFQYANDDGIRPAHLNERGDGLPWYANSYFKLFYELNAPRFPIFWEGIEANQLLMEKFIPYHLVFRILPPDQSSSPDAPNIPRVEEITEHIHNDPASGIVYGNHFFNDAIFYQWHGDFDLAESYYEGALRLNPKDTRALNNIGALLISRGRPSEAREKFEEAFQVDPDDPTSNHNLGQVLLDSGKAREAEPYFLQAVASDPGNFEDYYNLGLCYAASGKNKLAAEMFRQALRIKPESPQALSSLGVAYLRLQETENAEEFLKSAVRLEPQNAENWYNLACLHVLEGDTSDSVEDLKKALSINYTVAYDLASKDSRMSPLLDSILHKP